MLLSIIIPTYNRKDDLQATLESLIGQNFRDYEVFVIDNGPSTDGTRDIVTTINKNDERIHYISTDKQGCIFARNIGAEKSKGDILLTLDDDIELISPDTLDKMLEIFRTDPKSGIVGGIEIRSKDQVVPPGPEALPEDTGRILPNGEFNTAFGYCEGHGLTEVDHVRSAFMAVRTEIFVKVGGFDENYNAKGMGFRYESDLCLKVKRLGYKVILNPEIKIWHKAAIRARGFKRGRGADYFFYASRNHAFFMRRFFAGNRVLKTILRDIIIGTKAAPGFLHILKRLFVKGQMPMFINGPASIAGKIAGYLRYGKFNAGGSDK